MTPETDYAVVLYDGVCNLCSGTVRFIARRDPRAYFRFAPLQSPQGQAVLARYELPAEELKTLVLIEEGEAFTQSDAILRIARRLRRAWPLLALLRLIPRPLREAGYRWVATHRYRWFGVKPTCELPPEYLKTRFL